MTSKLLIERKAQIKKRKRDRIYPFDVIVVMYVYSIHRFIYTPEMRGRSALRCSGVFF